MCRGGSQHLLAHVAHAARHDGTARRVRLDVPPHLWPHIQTFSTKVFRGGQAHEQVKVSPQTNGLGIDLDKIDNAPAEKTDVGGRVEGVGSEQARVVQEVGSPAAAGTHVGDVAVAGQDVTKKGTQQRLVQIPLLKHVPPQHFYGRESNTSLLPLPEHGQGRTWPGAIELALALEEEVFVCGRPPRNHDGFHCAKVRLEELH
mmetsp:Transcript_61579/g.156476  ORF Transcript_61579/g.156476 Transcript_61579/m.156476 type:complete len:202 (-) Transcript_61579:621-1226(-)